MTFTVFTGPQLYMLVTSLHGLVGTLALALLLHPVITLRKATTLRWGTRFTAELAAGMLAVVFAVGWWTYPTYRNKVKPDLLVDQHPAWLWFEGKEHLAAMATVLAVSGALTLRFAGDDPDARRAAHALLASAWTCGVIAAIFGVMVRAVAQPGW